MKRIECLYEVYKKMDEYSQMIPNELSLSSYIKVELDKEKEVVYLDDNKKTITLNDDAFKLNLDYILDSIFDSLLVKDLLDKYEEYDDEEYILYAGKIVLLNAKYNKISEALDTL